MISINRFFMHDFQSSLIIEQINTTSCFLPLLWRASDLSMCAEFMITGTGSFFMVHRTWVTWWNLYGFAQRQAWRTDYSARLKQKIDCYYHLTRLQFVIEGFPYFCIKRWSQHIFSTHRRLSWAPPGGEWRGCPSAAPSASWPPRSADSLRCSGRWWPLCGRRHKRSSGGLWCCLPWFSEQTREE